jgi:hypothetical protein
MDRIENFDEITPREVYDRGFDDGYRRGLEIAERIKLQNQCVQRERDYLMKKLTEYELMRPLVISIQDGPHRLQSTSGD